MMFKPCLIVPVYNHGQGLQNTLGLLVVHAVPIYVVDDGSDQSTQAILAQLKTRYPEVIFVHLPHNQGKGAAVMAGFRQAHSDGCSHALQIDADGQHNTADVPVFLEKAQQSPEALVCGYPIYDDSVPKVRLYGRYATHVWVWIETLSFAIKDSMCGFRLYPLKATCDLIHHTQIPLRMDFDIEIAVRLAWMGVPVVNVPTQVVYPADGVSHFHMIKDNWRITKMHTRLFFGMLRRWPGWVLRGRRQTSVHWANQQERGGAWGLRFVMGAQKRLGRRLTGWLMHPVVAYFYCTAPVARKASQDFLTRVALCLNSSPPSPLLTYQHMHAFACSGIDKLAAWRGDLPTDQIVFHGKAHLERLAQQGKGALLLGSHLGNLEIMRALAFAERRITINAIMFTDHAEQFKSALSSVSDGFEVNLLQVRDMGVDTAILLKEKIERGEWLVIVGDRTPPNESQRVVMADFLGQPAPFAQGPMVLASLLECPVCLFFCVRDGGQYRVEVEPFADVIELPRQNRTESIQHWVQRYAQRLEAHALRFPLQWFNFFDFWRVTPPEASTRKNAKEQT